MEGSDDIDLSPYPAMEEKEPCNKNKEVIVQSLPHMPVIKDLVVNMDEFFHKYIDIKPTFIIKEPAPLYEQIMDAKNAHDLEKYVNCILCDACYAACPINEEDNKYLGPADLAKLYRFYIDSREPNHEVRLLRGDSLSGWLGCKFHTNCAKVCPKGVTPNTAIGKVRLALTSSGRSELKKENLK